MYNNNHNHYTFASREHGTAASQQRLTASNRNNEFIQTKTNVLKTNMSMLKAVMRHGVCVGLLAGLLLSLFLPMLSVAPGRLSRSLLAHAGHTSYAPITGLRVLGGLAGRLGFLRTAAFLLAAHVLGVRSTLLRQTPTGAHFPAMPWEEGLTRSIP